ncbi:TPA: SDR family NAD(P)-dependent oxidoreductase [Providencia stuartii]|uniref:SDR family NAD(P)-dependent oxidoreductase n=1 Tax=Providencia stuartii TaxID=588 RepID=UPI000536988C|nr:SDR family NAD(P)-dependent oxidoreductase [Providencia stuartii]AXO17496.1 SDR family NAD(P)-dependent oxidoreductase [Providencia stuartii]MBN5591544.1 SDR family NAD(P)-dependent oxidoreductase [Providencia stuartii]HEM6907236.1 SDR family NAD(P)-dependent oxidoreductase [Providencia stuartii]HEM7154587.1 SDR family NAD(P)-dependent oxidoreductase [Providencia stuartii]HEM7522957.1 SDR family NAD(P)-dependent oxidoreductase [Providencia stuartii]
MKKNLFGATSTADDVLNNIDLSHKRILVTGTSSGLGVEIARALTARGAHVIGTVRHTAKSEKQAHAIRGANPQGSFELVELDLSSLASVRTCSDKLLAAGKPIDIIINNAGVMATPFGHTADGFETQFGINHLGHFVLVNRLIPLLNSGSRVISVSSAGHRLFDFDINDLNFSYTDYQPQLAYSRSKTANILFAVEFDRRYRNLGIRACAIHPGNIATNLSRNMSAEDQAEIGTMINSLNQQAGLSSLETKTIPQGAATTVWAAAIADADEIGGQYCEDCQVAQVNDGPGFFGLRTYAIDPQLAKALWLKSEQMVGETFPQNSSLPIT